jgi:hypothetical protein
VLHSPTLAQRLAGAFDGAIVENAYEVRPRDDGECIEWVEHASTGDITYASEPHTNGWSRFWLGVFMALPIDWML